MNDLCGMETIQRKSRWATGIWNLLTYYIDLKKKYDPFDPLLVENSGYFSSVPVELLCVIFIQHKPCNFRKIALVNRRFYALVAHYTKTWTQLHRLYTTFISSPIFSLTRDQLDYISRIYHRRGLIKAEKETLTKKRNPTRIIFLHHGQQLPQEPAPYWEFKDSRFVPSEHIHQRQPVYWTKAPGDSSLRPVYRGPSYYHGAIFERSLVLRLVPRDTVQGTKIGDNGPYIDISNTGTKAIMTE